MIRSILLGFVGLMFSGFICFSQTPSPIYTTLEDAQVALQNGLLVTKLSLTKEKLYRVPEEIREYKDLIELRLDKNRIDELPDWLGELSKLVTFSAERNSIDVFPQVILELKNLKYLYLGDNLIPAIPIDIDNLENIEWLGFWSNLIRKFPASLSDLPNLQTLDLLHNDMTYLEQSWLRELLPQVSIEMSEPCNCVFDE